MPDIAPAAPPAGRTPAPSKAEEEAVNIAAGEGLPKNASFYTPEELRQDQRERLRGWLAFALVSLLFLVVVGSFVWLAIYGKSVDDLKELLLILFAPIVTLVGTALGFYFGGERSRPPEP